MGSRRERTLFERHRKRWCTDASCLSACDHMRTMLDDEKGCEGSEFDETLCIQRFLWSESVGGSWRLPTDLDESTAPTARPECAPREYAPSVSPKCVPRVHTPSSCPKHTRKLTVAGVWAPSAWSAL